MSARSDYVDRYQMYWTAPSARQGLRDYYGSKASGDTRTCYYCGEEFPLAEFWSNYKLGYVCSKDRGKSRSWRKKIEQQIAQDNKTKRQQKKEEKDSGGSPLKQVGGKIAGKLVERAVSRA